MVFIANLMIAWILASSFIPLVYGSSAMADNGTYLIQANITLDHCVSTFEWQQSTSEPTQVSSDFPLKATTSFDFPLSSDVLFLLSTGPESSGSLDIITSTQQQDDLATVHVVVGYYEKVIRDEASVCSVHKGAGSEGLLIYTPKLMHLRERDERLQFATTVILPDLSYGSPLVIKNFETDVENTHQRLGNLNEKVFFESLHLKGTNGDVIVGSLKADQGIIETSNGNIQGIFNTSNSWILSTKNGAIGTDVGLLSLDGSKPQVSMYTTNKAIISNISLLSSEGSGGSFEVNATTSNSPLTVNFPASPVDSVLAFNGQTSNGEAIVSLNPAYEGTFGLQTSNSHPTVVQGQNVKDPSGKNRKLIVDYDQSGNGDVYWQDLSGNFNHFSSYYSLPMKLCSTKNFVCSIFSYVMEQQMPEIHGSLDPLMNA